MQFPSGFLFFLNRVSSCGSWLDRRGSYVATVGLQLPVVFMLSLRSTHTQPLGLLLCFKLIFLLMSRKKCPLCCLTDYWGALWKYGLAQVTQTSSVGILWWYPSHSSSTPTHFSMKKTPAVLLVPSSPPTEQWWQWSRTFLQPYLGQNQLSHPLPFSLLEARLLPTVDRVHVVWLLPTADEANVESHPQAFRLHLFSPSFPAAPHTLTACLLVPSGLLCQCCFLREAFSNHST